MVWGLGFRVWPSVLGLGFWDVTQGFEFRVLGFCSGFRVFGSGVGFWDSAWGLGFGLGFWG